MDVAERHPGRGMSYSGLADLSCFQIPIIGALGIQRRHDAQGAMAAGEATGGVATDAAGLPITEGAGGITASEAAGTAAGGGLLSGITGSQALVAGLLASSLLGKAQQPATLPQPTGVTAPPSLQTQAGVDPNTILSSLTGVGQGGGQKGVAQTLLTGAGGVDPSTLTLNKKTLLGS